MQKGRSIPQVTDPIVKAWTFSLRCCGFWLTVCRGSIRDKRKVLCCSQWYLHGSTLPRTKLNPVFSTFILIIGSDVSPKYTSCTPGYLFSLAWSGVFRDRHMFWSLLQQQTQFCCWLLKVFIHHLPIILLSSWFLPPRWVPPFQTLGSISHSLTLLFLCWDSFLWLHIWPLFLQT